MLWPDLYSTSVRVYNNISKGTQARLHHKAQLSRGTNRRRDEEKRKDNTNATYETRDAQRRTATEEPQFNGQYETYSVCVCVWVYAGVGEGKSVLFARNLTLNSDATPNYKYMFGPHRGPPPHT